MIAGSLTVFSQRRANRGALIIGPLMQQAVTIAIQAIIMLLLAFAVGARFSGGIPGVIVLIISSMLLGVAVGALSVGAAMLVRREDALIGAIQFFLLPLMFLSSVLMPQDLAPGWIQMIARVNPANWAVEAGREALGANVDWLLVFSRLGLLLIFVIICAWLATRAFRTYQRSV